MKTLSLMAGLAVLGAASAAFAQSQPAPQEPAAQPAPAMQSQQAPAEPAQPAADPEIGRAHV